MISLKDLSSLSVKSSISAIVTTKNEIINMPKNIISVPIIRPKKVLGKISPYPQLTKVIMTFQTEFYILEKSWPETSFKGDSKIRS